MLMRKNKMNPQKIGKKTILPTMEQIQKYIIFERKEAIKNNIQTQINKLAQANQTTPQEVIKNQQYSLDEAKDIAEQTIHNIKMESIAEYDTLTPEEKQILRAWKRQLRDNRDTIINNAVNTIFAELY